MDIVKEICGFLFDFYAIRCDARADDYEHKAQLNRKTAVRAKGVARLYVSGGLQVAPDDSESPANEAV